METIQAIDNVLIVLPRSIQETHRIAVELAMLIPI
jgi:hypothetical protein